MSRNSYSIRPKWAQTSAPAYQSVITVNTALTLGEYNVVLNALLDQFEACPLFFADNKLLIDHVMSPDLVFAVMFKKLLDHHHYYTDPRYKKVMKADVGKHHGEKILDDHVAFVSKVRSHFRAHEASFLKTVNNFCRRGVLPAHDYESILNKSTSSQSILFI